jgi:hypothetical protein
MAFREQGMYLDLDAAEGNPNCFRYSAQLKGTFLLTFSTFRSGGLGPPTV